MTYQWRRSHCNFVETCHPDFII